jgi:hypothetical protein
MKHPIEIFRERLLKIGIEIQMVGNFPWVYLEKVNGKLVTERFLGNHGFTIGFMPVRTDREFSFTDITEIFKILRKYR